MNGVRLERLEIYAGAGDAVQAFAGGGSLSNLAVTHCQIYANNQRSVSVTGVQGMRIEDNDFRTVNSTVVADIYLYLSASVEISGNRITGGGTGILLDRSSGSRITGNTISGAATGINLAGASGVLVRDNVCSGNITGIDLSTDSVGSLYNNLEGNLLSGNSNSGLIIRSGSTGNAYGRNRSLNNGAGGAVNYSITASNRSAGDNCDQTVCTN
jgi:parallel beta-helix repeat protein